MSFVGDEAGLTSRFNGVFMLRLVLAGDGRVRVSVRYGRGYVRSAAVRLS